MMKLDRRTKKYKRYVYWFNKYTKLAFVLGILAGTLLGIFLYKYQKAHLVSSKTIELIKPLEVKAYRIPCDYDPLMYIRCRGQELGYDDYIITKFIKIARAESGFNLDQYAKNPNSTAKGIFQFTDGTWRQYCLKDGNVYDFKVNINCFYKILQKEGVDKGLNHWNASRSKWDR